MGNAIGDFTENTLYFFRKGEKASDSNSKGDAVSTGINTVGATGSAHKALESINNLDTALASTNVQSVVSAFDNSVFSDSVKKVTSTCADLTNTCMYVGSAHNILSDKDSKTKAGVEEGTSFLGMQAMETASRSGIENVVEKLPSTGYWSAVKAVATAALLVTASVGGAIGGKKLGKVVTGRS